MELKTWDEFVNEEAGNEKRYRMVSDYGYGDKTWHERGLDSKGVKAWFIKNTEWTSEEFDEVGIEYFLDSDSDAIHYPEVDNENDVEDWDWEDS